MFDSQLNKLKPKIKTVTVVTLNLTSNNIGNSNDEVSFPHKLLVIQKLPLVSFKAL